ncbi:MAG: hypothetical protein Q9210_004267 [Variospora velana]
MHHHLLFLLPLVFILALPSFALFNKNGYINSTSAPNGVELQFTGRQNTYTTSVASFNSLSLIGPIANITNIAIIGLNPPVKGKNDTGFSFTLNISDIVCECFEDPAGKNILGTPFTIAATPEDPGLPLPNGTINSIFCSDLRGLQRYFNNTDITPEDLKKEFGILNGTALDNSPAGGRPSSSSSSPSPSINANGVPPRPFAYLGLEPSENSTDVKMVSVSLTGDPVPVSLSAISVNLAGMVKENGNSVGGQGVLCQVFFEGEDAPLDVRAGPKMLFDTTKKTVKTVKSVRCVKE